MTDGGAPGGPGHPGDQPEGQRLADRVARLEDRMDRLDRLDRLEAGRLQQDEPPGVAEPAEIATGGPGRPAAPANPFWALNGLKERAGDPGAVLFTGTVTLPGGEHYEWQEGHLLQRLLAENWAESAAALAALAHPVRLLLLHEVLTGARTAAELGRHEQLGTSGQLYHHLRQLVSAGWLRTSLRGQYAVPAERVVPLLALLAAARR